MSEHRAERSPLTTEARVLIYVILIALATALIVTIYHDANRDTAPAPSQSQVPSGCYIDYTTSQLVCPP